MLPADGSWTPPASPASMACVALAASDLILGLVTGVAVLAHTDLFSPQDLELSASVQLVQASVHVASTLLSLTVLSPGSLRAWGTAGALLPRNTLVALPWR